MLRVLLFMIGWLIVLAFDPARVPTPPPKPTVVYVAPKAKPKPTPSVVVVKPSIVLAQAQAMVDTVPWYSVEDGWCWHFVEDALERSGSGLSTLAGGMNETTKPRPGDLVYFLLPSTRTPAGFVAHVGIIESMDADWVYVIDGNGAQSSTLIQRNKYPRANVSSFVKTK